MIIQIRGTSGSGKTTVMRKLFEKLPKLLPQYKDGRKAPLYYMTINNIAILGHYESACGGCDNIGSAKSVFELIQFVKRLHKGSTIICEGLLLSEDVKWSSQLTDLRVMFLTTAIETCIEQIINRRKEAGNEKPLNESNTRNRVAVIERARLRLVEAGVYCRRASSSQAVSIILDWIKSNESQDRRA